MHQPGPFGLAEMVGDLRLPHSKLSLELADAGVLIPGWNAAVRQLAAPPSIGEHPQHRHPDRVGERPAQRYEPVGALLIADIYGPRGWDTTLLENWYLPSRHPPNTIRHSQLPQVRSSPPRRTGSVLSA
jgi:hypothetical protein